MKKNVLVFLLVMLGLSFPATPLYAQKHYHGDGIDDILRFVPLAGAITLKTCGVDSRSDWQHFALNAALSTTFTVATTYAFKQTVHSTRPDGTDDHSFPSGHTSLVFSGAHILHKEYGKLSPWISVAGYTVATVTAFDRIRRNRHHWPDVAAGAAIGILSTEASYCLSSIILPTRQESLSFTITPSNISFSLNW